MTTPDFSIIIPAFNEARLSWMMQAVARSLTGDMYAELVVVDDSSPDPRPMEDAEKTATQIAGKGRLDVQVVQTPRRSGPKGANNFGRCVANGPVSVFVDTQTVPGGGALERLAQAVMEEDDTVAGPTTVSLSSVTATERLTGVYNDVAPDKVWPLAESGKRNMGLGARLISDYSMWSQWTKGTEMPIDRIQVQHGCQAIRAEGWPHLYDERLAGYWGQEDVEICLRAWRLGYTVVGVRDAIVAVDFGPPQYGGFGGATYWYNAVRLAMLYFGDHVFEQVVRYWRDAPSLNR